MADGGSETTAGDAATDLTGLHALVVDDNATNRLILTEMLTTWGLRATSVGTGQEAVDELVQARARGGGYDLVLLDAHMPEMDGFEVARRIREDDQLSDPMVMMLTSGGYADDVERVRRLGLVSYLVKPVRRARLLETIRAAVASGTGAPEQEAEPMPDAVEEGAPGAGRTPRILLVDDQPENRMLVEAYLKPQGFDVETAVNGEEAVDRVTVEEESFDVVLMDMRMPVMDGYEATRRIREWEERTGRPRSVIVALTAHALKEERVKTREAGCDEHMTKPIKKKELVDALTRIVAERDRAEADEED